MDDGGRGGDNRRRGCLAAAGRRPVAIEAVASTASVSTTNAAASTDAVLPSSPMPSSDSCNARYSACCSVNPPRSGSPACGRLDLVRKLLRNPPTSEQVAPQQRQPRHQAMLVQQAQTAARPRQCRAATSRSTHAAIATATGAMSRRMACGRPSTRRRRRCRPRRPHCRPRRRPHRRRRHSGEGAKAAAATATAAAAAGAGDGAKVADSAPGALTGVVREASG